LNIISKKAGIGKIKLNNVCLKGFRIYQKISKYDSKVGENSLDSGDFGDIDSKQNEMRKLRSLRNEKELEIPSIYSFLCERMNSF